MRGTIDRLGRPGRARRSSDAGAGSGPCRARVRRARRGGRWARGTPPRGLANAAASASIIAVLGKAIRAVVFFRALAFAPAAAAPRVRRLTSRRPFSPLPPPEMVESMKALCKLDAVELSVRATEDRMGRRAAPRFLHRARRSIRSGASFFRGRPPRDRLASNDPTRRLSPLARAVRSPPPPRAPLPRAPPLPPAVPPRRSRVPLAHFTPSSRLAPRLLTDRGAQPPVGWVQKRHRRSPRVVAHPVLDRG